MNAPDADPVFRKTVKGQEAIASRTHGLAARMRSLLILVDGQRRQSALFGLAMGFGDVAQMLAQLQADGFIEPAMPVAATGGPGTAPAMPTAAMAPASGPVPLGADARSSGPAPLGAATAPAQSTLPQAKQFATRQLMQILGPTSDALCLRVEAARTQAEFITAIRRAYAVVAEVRGRSQAEAFGAAIEARLPPA